MVLLVESTSNQVNQDGGYTGMRPREFAEHLARITLKAGLSGDQVWLGGDHLGPYPWRSRPAAAAMQNARTLVADCVTAGYRKIHLDPSMGCADDRRPLSKATVAERTADLCEAAEEAYSCLPEDTIAPCYVIGADVPPPGGGTGEINKPGVIQITQPEDVEETIETTHRALARRGLEAAWERVIAIVVQPGVDFSDTSVLQYDRRRAEPLSRFIARHPRLVYEAHSTDYQTPDSLRELVEDHFAILKVGPALTFAFREAVFALTWIEREWLEDRPDVLLSDLPVVLDRAMLADPRYWAVYYHGEPREVGFARRYGYSDRVRYYWNRPEVQMALARLFGNLEREPPPPTLLSQFLPRQYTGVREGRLGGRPQDWVADHIAAVLQVYVEACRAGAAVDDPRVP
jgi:D-tagatose-1,6-bisphosphate aldolase subunit GatZ/KbaZ